MASGRSWRLTPDERRDLWWRWREGQTLSAIGAALSVASVFAVVRSRGGFLGLPDFRGPNDNVLRLRIWQASSYLIGLILPRAVCLRWVL